MLFEIFLNASPLCILFGILAAISGCVEQIKHVKIIGIIFTAIGVILLFLAIFQPLIPIIPQY
jgi:energy-converting hydrogenase Eha subunit E